MPKAWNKCYLFVIAYKSERRVRRTRKVGMKGNCIWIGGRKTYQEKRRRREDRTLLLLAF